MADACTAPVPCSNAANIGERKTWTQSEYCTRQNSVTGQEPPKMYSVPAQETDSQTSCKVWKSGWPPLSDVDAVMKPRCETRWNLLYTGCPKLPTRSQPLVSRKEKEETTAAKYNGLPTIVNIGTISDKTTSTSHGLHCMSLPVALMQCAFIM